MKLRLYHYWRSSSSWRVRWAFALKKIPCDFVAVNLLDDETETPEHRLRNPLGFVPALEFLDRKEPYHYIAESMAIIEWAEETKPEPRLLPGDAFERARIRQLAELINAGTQPLQNLNTTHRHSSDKAEQKKWNQYWIHHGLEAYETLVSETAQTFSVGNSVTMADLFLIPQCYNAQRNDVNLDSFPKIKAIYEAARVTAACHASHPDRYKPQGE